MARIPLYTERETYSGKPSQVFSLEGEKTKALTIPFVEDTRLQSVADALNYVGDKMVEAEELDQYNNGLVGIKKGADAIVEDANTNWRDLDLEGHMKAFNESWASVEEGVEDNVKSNNTKRALAVQFETTKLSTMAEVRGIAHKRTHDKLIADSVVAKEYFLDGAINAKDEGEAADNIQNLFSVNAGLVATGAITEEQAAVNNEKYEGMMNKGFLNRFVEENNTIVIEDNLRIRTPKEVYEKLSKQQTFRNLNELEKDEIVKHAYTVYKSNGVLSRQAEADAEKKKKKEVADNDFTVIKMYNEGKLTKTLLNDYAGRRDISREMYEKISNDMEQEEKTPTIKKDVISVIAIGNLADDIASGKTGPETRKKLDDALIANQISRTTYITYRTKMSNTDYQRGLKEINNLMKPLPFEAMTPNAALGVRTRHSQAIEDYNKEVANGVDPAKAAADQVKKYRIETGTTGLPSSDIEIQRQELMTKRANLKADLKSNLIKKDEYDTKMRLLKKKFDALTIEQNSNEGK